MNRKEHAITIFTVFYVVFVVLGLSFIGRILWIQYVEGAALRTQGEKLAYTESELPASRGNILAEDGRLLATSMPMYSIHMDLLAAGLTDSLFSANVDSLAWALANFFRDRSKEVYKKNLLEQRIRGNRYYPLGDKPINYLRLKELRKFPLLRLASNRGGLIVECEESRMKPLGMLASRTIGRTNAGSGVGLEGAYNDDLQGKPGLRIMQRAPGGKLIPLGSADYLPAQDGYDIRTTIDVNLQDVATRALYEQLQRNDAEHGTVVVMEVATGEVKAIANLTKTSEGEYSEQINYAVGASTEPGSTFKLATLIALLEDGKVKLTDSIDTGNGQLKVYDQTITDSRHGGYGVITVQQAWELSSNVAVAKLVMKHYQGHADEFISRLHAMHLHQPLGLPILGEGRPYIKAPGDTLWSGVSLPMMSIGYEVQQTPLQVLTFYNAIANNGCMVKPQFIKDFIHHGKVVYRFQPEVIVPSLCSGETIGQVKQVLQGVVQSGTAKNLQTAVYTIAGKTGTAQIARGKTGYRNDGKTDYQASFVGYFPAENPRYSCIVVVTSPSQSGYYGNVVAGPIFREIAEKVYATRSEWFPWYTDSKQPSGDALPATKSGQKQNLTAIFRILGIPYRDDAVSSQWVSTVRKEAAIHLEPYSHLPGYVPNVVGFPLSDALYLLENSGLRVRFRGRGSVKAQSIAPGQPIRKGAEIDLEMSVI